MIDFEQTNRLWAGISAEKRIEHALELFGHDDIVFTSSFGAMGAGVCALWSSVAPGLKVYFLDTGFHFPETLAYGEEILKRLNLQVEIIRPKLTRAQLEERLGPRPYETDSAECCRINKVEPLDAMLEGKKGWISAVRRSQSAFRAKLDFVVPTERGVHKLHPILDWTTRDLYEYTVSRGLPVHPLYDRGYVSIGCAPCTAPCHDPNDERAGRWPGQNKSECGLHLRPGEVGSR